MLKRHKTLFIQRNYCISLVTKRDQSTEPLPIDRMKFDLLNIATGHQYATTEIDRYLLQTKA